MPVPRQAVLARSPRSKPTCAKDRSEDIAKAKAKGVYRGARLDQDQAAQGRWHGALTDRQAARRRPRLGLPRIGRLIDLSFRLAGLFVR